MILRNTLVRRAAAAAVAVGGCALGAGTGTALAETACQLRGSETVVENRLARVYTVTRGTRRHVLCTRRTGRSLWLDPPAEDLDIDRVNRFRLRGGFLAYQRLHVVFRGRSTFTIELRDVRTRRLTRRVDAAPDGGAVRPSSARDGVRDLVVSRRGALAWIVQNPYAPGPRLQVWRSDAAGEALLDQGDRIDPSSLSLADGVVRWRTDGERRSTRLQD